MKYTTSILKFITKALEPLEFYLKKNYNLKNKNRKN